jgi:membrane protein
MTNSSRSQGSLLSTLLRRSREERLAQTAGGLTFTMVVSMVPLLAVCFAVFAWVPALRTVGEVIREYLLRGLLPPDIAKTVVKHLAQFSGNARGLTLVGFVVLLVSALALVLSVESTLNRIWQVKKARPVLRRLALCAALLVCAPVIIGASLWAVSYLLTVSHGLAGMRPTWLLYALKFGPVVLSATGFACLFRFVPNTVVPWSHAAMGGLLAGIAFELGKHGFAFYLAHVPTYRTIYGAFAPLLAFLLWVYYSWFVTLAAALVSASLRRTGARAARQRSRT